MARAFSQPALAGSMTCDTRAFANLACFPRADERIACQVALPSGRQQVDLDGTPLLFLLLDHTTRLAGRCVARSSLCAPVSVAARLLHHKLSRHVRHQGHRGATALILFPHFRLAVCHSRTHVLLQSTNNVPGAREAPVWVADRRTSYIYLFGGRSWSLDTAKSAFSASASLLGLLLACSVLPRALVVPTIAPVHACMSSADAGFVLRRRWLHERPLVSVLTFNTTRHSALNSVCFVWRCDRRYNIQTNAWTWLSGSTKVEAPSVYPPALMGTVRISVLRAVLLE